MRLFSDPESHLTVGTLLKFTAAVVLFYGIVYQVCHLILGG